MQPPPFDPKAPPYMAPGRTPQIPLAAPKNAINDIVAERLRQVSVEGWSPEHDDNHSCGELADAAACYASPAPHGVRPQSVEPPAMWPWSREWWKPKDRRSNLVRAAALIVAEIERLDRAALSPKE